MLDLEGAVAQGLGRNSAHVPGQLHGCTSPGGSGLTANRVCRQASGWEGALVHCTASPLPHSISLLGTFAGLAQALLQPHAPGPTCLEERGLSRKCRCWPFSSAVWGGRSCPVPAPHSSLQGRGCFERAAVPSWKLRLQQAGCR